MPCIRTAPVLETSKKEVGPNLCLRQLVFVAKSIQR
jgi:hypothetical protein